MAGVVEARPARVTVEFSDLSTAEADTAFVSDGKSLLFAARVPNGQDVRAVIPYDARGTQIRRIGRPLK